MRYCLYIKYKIDKKSQEINCKLLVWHSLNRKKARVEPCHRCFQCGQLKHNTKENPVKLLLLLLCGFLDYCVRSGWLRNGAIVSERHRRSYRIPTKIIIVHPVL